MKRNDFVLWIIVEGKYPTNHTFIKYWLRNIFQATGYFLK
jgi:hypothetical protein